ncbi:MAG: hypothetical protein IT437_03455 [Phycisphaerales bacterium]|nr:hypothetical protein [Phycisphaerales bacterium]
MSAHEAEATITFNVSGADKHVSMWQAFKCAGDAQFRPPFEVKAGLAPYVDSQWGDYSGTNPDPIAPAIFWGHAQVPAGAGGTSSVWETWVSRRTLDCGLDVDGDGIVSAMDFAAYMGLYAQGAPAADYRADGVISSLDAQAISTDLGSP